MIRNASKLLGAPSLVVVPAPFPTARSKMYISSKRQIMFKLLVLASVGDFTKINIPNKDAGGELDPHGADGNGNPIGGLVYGDSFGKGLQYHEWTSFISSDEFCFRACTGANAARNCQHIYDIMGCYWNMPANYDAGVFENCKGDNDLPMVCMGHRHGIKESSRHHLLIPLLLLRRVRLFRQFPSRHCKNEDSNMSVVHRNRHIYEFVFTTFRTT